MEFGCLEDVIRLRISDNTNLSSFFVLASLNLEGYRFV